MSKLQAAIVPCPACHANALHLIVVRPVDLRCELCNGTGFCQEYQARAYREQAFAKLWREWERGKK